MGKTKQCPKCRKIKPLIQFYDHALVTLEGRICRACKKVKHDWTFYNINMTDKELKTLDSFIFNPEIYGIDTEEARQKIQYLESILHKFTTSQKRAYSGALKSYNSA